MRRRNPRLSLGTPFVFVWGSGGMNFGVIRMVLCSPIRSAYIPNMVLVGIGAKYVLTGP